MFILHVCMLETKLKSLFVHPMLVKKADFDSGRNFPHTNAGDS